MIKGSKLRIKGKIWKVTEAWNLGFEIVSYTVENTVTKKIWEVSRKRMDELILNKEIQVL